MDADELPFTAEEEALDYKLGKMKFKIKLPGRQSISTSFKEEPSAAALPTPKATAATSPIQQEKEELPKTSPPPETTTSTTTAPPTLSLKVRIGLPKKETSTSEATKKDEPKKEEVKQVKEDPDLQTRKRAKIKVVTTRNLNLSNETLNFDPANNIRSSDWDSRVVLDDEPLIETLEKVVPYDVQGESPQPLDKGKNTVVIWATMPDDSTRFSFNICKTSSYQVNVPETVVLYQFGPRENKQAILQSSLMNQFWSTDVDRSIKGFPIEKGKQFQLRLTFCVQGIAVYLDGRLVSEFANRYGAIDHNKDLFLVVPTTDEVDTEPEKVIVHRVWWGYTVPTTIVPTTMKKRLAFTPETKPQEPLPRGKSNPGPQHQPSDDAIADCALFIAGLPKNDTAESELRRIFEHYQVDSIDNKLCLVADPAKGQGVVKLQNSTHVTTAINYLNTSRMLPGADSNLIVVAAKKRQVPAWFQC